ncbi:signal peptidase II [Thioclava sp. FR2]|uniref:signal peptidase II n=1 Tax=Thioclava sp. FR2 TaxID=3445780 RepID=UPI003EB82D5C
MKQIALIASLTFALDQISKWAVVQGMNLIERGVIEIVPPFLVFRMAWNKGINFGLFAGEGDLVRWGLIVLSLVITGWVWIWMSKGQHRPLALASAGLLIGGALGNVIDRVVYGAVADFLNMSCCGIENPFAFNVADIAIFVGAFGLVLFTGSGKDEPKARRQGRKTP